MGKDPTETEVRITVSVATTQETPRRLREELREAAQQIREQVRREIQQNVQTSADRIVIQSPAPPLPGVSAQEGERVQVFTGTEMPSGPHNEQIPPEAVEISLAFFLMVATIVIGLPISRAFARRMDRKAAAPAVSPEVSAQLGQLTQAVDAIALEVERISENQRFTTRLLSEQRDMARQTLPAGREG